MNQPTSNRTKALPVVLPLALFLLGLGVGIAQIEIIGRMAEPGAFFPRSTFPFLRFFTMDLVRRLFGQFVAALLELIFIPVTLVGAPIVFACAAPFMYRKRETYGMFLWVAVLGLLAFVGRAIGLLPCTYSRAFFQITPVFFLVTNLVPLAFLSFILLLLPRVRFVGLGGIVGTAVMVGAYKANSCGWF